MKNRCQSFVYIDELVVAVGVESLILWRIDPLHLYPFFLHIAVGVSFNQQERVIRIKGISPSC